MNGFMVLARFAMDDVPLRLFSSYDQADIWIRNIKDIRRYAMSAARDTMNLDSSILTGVDIFEFENGFPKKCYHVSHYNRDKDQLEFSK